MSIITTATFEDHEYEVEIFRDGSLEFLNYDIQKDIAEHEFGYPKTSAMRIKNIWQLGAPQAIVALTPLSLEHLVLLAADWAEHTVHLYNEQWQDSYYERNHLELVRSLERARAYARSGFSDKNLGREVFEYERQTSSIYSEQYQVQSKQAGRAVWNVLNAAQAPSAAAAVSNIQMVSEAATKAASLVYQEKPGMYGPNWVVTFDGIGYDHELVWEVQRFVDCMEAVGSGGDWPPLEATP